MKAVPTPEALAVPPDLLQQIQAAADEQHRSVGDVLRDAIQRYVDARAWDKLFSYGEQRATALGLSEADIPRLIAEVRAEHRQDRG